MAVGKGGIKLLGLANLHTGEENQGQVQRESPYMGGKTTKNKGHCFEITNIDHNVIFAVPPLIPSTCLPVLGAPSPFLDEIEIRPGSNKRRNCRFMDRDNVILRTVIAATIFR